MLMFDRGGGGVLLIHVPWFHIFFIQSFAHHHQDHPLLINTASIHMLIGDGRPDSLLSWMIGSERSPKTFQIYYNICYF